MNRYSSLAVLGLVLGGCAAEFSEEQSPETNAPASSDQTTDDTVIKTYGGQLQRPAETLGTVDDAPQSANARAIRNYMERIELADRELGPQFNRSITQ